MSIPSYQFPSLAGENIAKRRVMKRAKKGFQTEEQRAIKSGKVDDNIKNIFKAVISNLELQISTIQIGKAIGASVIGEEGAINEVDESMVSKVVGTLGRLVRLSSQFVVLMNSLGDLAISNNRPTFDTGKIFQLLNQVERERGNFNASGFGLLLGFITEALIEDDRNPDDVYALDFLYGENLNKGVAILNQFDNNAYQAELKDVQIPIRQGRNINPERTRAIATGEERRNFTAQEYVILKRLHDEGVLGDDDFTSVYSGDDGTIFSGSSGTSYYAEDSDEEDSDEEDSDSEEGDSDDDTPSVASSGIRFNPNRYARSVASSKSSRSSRGVNPFGEFKYVPRASKPTYFDDSSSTGSGLYTIPQQARRGTNMSSGYAIPIRYN